MTPGDTIFGLSSGLGRAGVAVIRCSGPGARNALEGLCGHTPEPRLAKLAKLVSPATGDVLDVGLIIYFPGPGSATGEDVAEFHIHGAPAVVAVLLKSLAGMAGFRIAEPGEFSRRAFLNGKLDLVEIEGLADLLSAQTESQRQQAMAQFLGGSSSVFEGWRSRMIRSQALVEAAVDFSEEEDVGVSALDQAKAESSLLAAEMASALKQSKSGEVIREGVRVVLAGLPNTGKSSLLNALAKREAAIVSSIPGTTRDIIEVSLDIEGIPVVLSDTAGLRDATSDMIEEIGIARTRRKVAEADVVIWVAAGDVPGSSEIPAGLLPAVKAWSKADLECAMPDGFDIALSAERGRGMAEFTDVLGHLIRARYGHGVSALVVRARQREAVERSIRHLNNVLGTRVGPAELMAEELRAAAHELGRLTGRIDVEDLLGAIFSEFCIGK